MFLDTAVPSLKILRTHFPVGGHVMSDRVNRVEASKQMLQTDDVKHRFFRTPEDIPFPKTPN